MGAEDPAQPHITDPGYRFPDMVPGDEVRHVFVIANPVDTPLCITRVRTSCGCTAGSVEPETIAPHGEGKLEVVFKTIGRTGPQRKHIFVSTDSLQAPLLRCSVEGTLLPPVTSVPAVVNRATQPAAGAASSRPSEPTTNAAGKPDPTPPQPTGQSVSAAPDALLFLNVPTGTTAERSFVLRSADGQAFQPVRVTAGCSDLAWRFAPLDADHSSWQVFATYQAKGNARRFQCQGRVILADGQSVSIFLSGNVLEATAP